MEEVKVIHVDRMTVNGESYRENCGMMGESK